MDYTVDADTGQLTVTTRGTADRDGFLRLVDGIVGHPEFVPGTTVLIDHSRLDMAGLQTEDMQAVADTVLRLNERIGRTVVAIVTPAAVSYGLARQFTAFADLADLRVRVFSDLPDAIVWLDRESAGTAG